MKLKSYLKANFLNETINWNEHELCEHMNFSARDTHYTLSTFPRSMHFHDYYELVIYLTGDVRYMNEGESFTPEPGDAVINPPAHLHTALITRDKTRYVRYVFYFYPDAFDMIGGNALMDFVSAGHFCVRPQEKQRQELFALLDRLRDVLRDNRPGARAIALSYAVQVFLLLSACAPPSAPNQAMAYPPVVDRIRQHIDEHFTEIASVGDVAAHFFYSREYVARLFKRYLNTTVSDYLLKRRVAYCRQLMEGGMPLIQVSMCAGFGSISSFIRAFESVTGMPPSAYRRKMEQNAIR